VPAKDAPRLTLNAWMTHGDRRCNSAGEVAARVKETASRDVPSHHRTHERTASSPPFLPPQPSQPSLPSIVSISSICVSVSANAAVVLIGVAVTLLARQLASLAEAFETEAASRNAAAGPDWTGDANRERQSPKGAIIVPVSRLEPCDFTPTGSRPVSLRTGKRIENAY